MSSVLAHDVPLHHLYSVMKVNGPGTKISLEINRELGTRMRIDHVFESFGRAHSVPSYRNRKLKGSAAVDPSFPEPTDYVLPRNFDCLRKLIRTYEKTCELFHEYALQYVSYLVEACENLPESDRNADALADRLEEACEH